MEENALFELMVHLMEFGMIAGIVAVVAFTLVRNRHGLRMDDPASARLAADARPDHR